MLVTNPEEDLDIDPHWTTLHPSMQIHPSTSGGANEPPDVDGR